MTTHVPEQTLIELSGVSAGHGATPVLTGVDWRVRAGESWFVVGPNGAGKTTLLATALGRLPPLAGTVRRAPSLRVASIPQHCGLIRDLPVTVAEFVALGLPHAGRDSHCVDALAVCGMSALAARQVWSLSGGERRRALIARALAQKPALLALDEPTAGLDATAERELLTTITALARDGMAVLFITHDLRIATAYASKVAVVADRRLTVVAPDRAIDALFGRSSG